jgi:hypothetical protein
MLLPCHPCFRLQRLLPTQPLTNHLHLKNLSPDKANNFFKRCGSMIRFLLSPIDVLTSGQSRYVFYALSNLIFVLYISSITDKAVHMDIFARLAILAGGTRCC